MPPSPKQFDRVNTAGVNPTGLGDTIGFWALAFFVFSIFSSVFDSVGLVRVIRPSLLAAAVGLTAWVLSGRAVVVLKHKVSLMFIALTFWDVACLPFAVWPGGSAHTIIGGWLVTVLTFFLVAGLIVNLDEFRKITHVIAYASIILSLVALKGNAVSIEGRLMLPESRYANPNDLATILLTALPFLWIMAMRKGNGLRRPLALCGAVPVLLAIARTGSRSALIGACVAMGALFLQIGLAGKIKLVLAGVVVFGVLVAAMPSQLAERFTTIFGANDVVYDQQEEAMLESAIESSYSRRMLLMDSLTLTFQHPVFGVGLGNFPVAQNDLAKARGERMGSWHVTHNTYTQVSSESGIPGLVLFLLAIFFSFGALSRVLRMARPSNAPAWQDIYMLATSLRIAFLGFLTCCFFASMAYLPIFTAMCGLTVSLELCARGLAATTIPTAYAAQAMQTFQAIKRPPHPRQLPHRA
jgi:hypothetical protein